MLHGAVLLHSRNLKLICCEKVISINPHIYLNEILVISVAYILRRPSSYCRESGIRYTKVPFYMCFSTFTIHQLFQEQLRICNKCISGIMMDGKKAFETLLKLSYRSCMCSWHSVKFTFRMPTVSTRQEQVQYCPSSIYANYNTKLPVKELAVRYQLNYSTFKLLFFNLFLKATRKLKLSLLI